MKTGNLIAKLRNRALGGPKASEWKEIEYFDPTWENRVSFMAAMIKGRGRLVDFGCGQQHLRKHLPPGTEYVPVDYASRSPDTIVADFNVLPYQRIDGQIAFISGFLEYVQDAPSFIRHIKGLSYQEIVMSYCDPCWLNSSTLSTCVKSALSPKTLSLLLKERNDGRSAFQPDA
jgi:hypothetical protein